MTWRTRKKRKCKFPPYSEMLTRLALPPRTEDVAGSSIARRQALVAGIKREIAKMREEEEQE